MTRRFYTNPIRNERPLQELDESGDAEPAIAPGPKFSKFTKALEEAFPGRLKEDVTVSKQTLTHCFNFRVVNALDIVTFKQIC